MEPQNSFFELFGIFANAPLCGPLFHKNKSRKKWDSNKKRASSSGDRPGRVKENGITGLYHDTLIIHIHVEI